MIGRGRGRGRGRVSPGSTSEVGSGSSGASSPAPPPGGLQVDVEAERLRGLSLSGESDSCISSRSASASRLESEPSPGLSYALQKRQLLQPPVKLAPRPEPGFGREGQRIALLTNHFVVSLPRTELMFYHYDVQIVENKKMPNGSIIHVDWTGLRVPRFTRDEVRETAYKVFTKWAQDSFGDQLEQFFTLVYDRQSHAYTPINFGNVKEGKQVILDGREFKVKLTLNKECPIITISKASLYETVFEKPAERDRAPLQVLDILHNQMMYFKSYLKQSDYVPHGRCFYKPTSIDIGMGRNLKEGFVKSLRIVAGNPTDLNASQFGFTLTMNIDVKLSPFFNEQRLDLTASQTLNLRQVPPNGLPGNDVASLRRHFADLRVRTRHNNRVFTIRSVSDKPASQQIFRDDKGEETTVADYFAKKYTPLQFPTLQCVINEAGHFIPMEMCNVLPNQKVDLKKMTPDQTRKIIQNAAVHPEIRMKDIIKKSEEFSGGGDDPFLKHLQIGRSLEMMKVDGRVLRHPVVVYSNQAPCDVRNGSWTISRQHRFFAPATVTNFILVCFNHNVGIKTLEQFAKGLAQKARDMGMQIPECIAGDCIKLDQLKTVIEKYKREFNINLVICIMDETRQQLLKNQVKLCEQQTNVVTQCILSKTVEKFAKNPSGSGMLFENIAFKLNLKCGGINNFISFQQDPVAQEWFQDDVMFVGMDVNHPPPLSKREIAMNKVPLKPSVVGAVANVGKHVAMYAMQVKTQDARREAISDDNMRSIMKEFIDQFEINRKKRPQRIVVYRDGVSESQFAMVLQQETLSIKTTFAKYDGDYQPKLTVITAQKRHNTRFFREVINERQKPAEKNVPSGTVVDTGPVSAYQFEFFLASQAGIQGTTKAPNYVVIYDDNKFSQDTLQRLTFLLCHVYQRCTKSVSLPAPCYFAHHAATRGKELVDGFLNTADDTSSVSSSDFRLPDFERINESIKYNPEIGNRMLFL